MAVEKGSQGDEGQPRHKGAKKQRAVEGTGATERRAADTQGRKGTKSGQWGAQEKEGQPSKSVLRNKGLSTEGAQGNKGLPRNKGQENKER
jgi:hypothetical protein